MATRARKPKTDAANETVPVVEITETPVRAWKGFDKDLKCREFQFAVGETYEHDGPIELCATGFHACTHPTSVLTFYSAAKGSRFAEVLMYGALDKTDETSKRVCKKITISKEISLQDLILAESALVLERTKDAPEKATGTRGSASATGYGGSASATGYGGSASATGEYSKVECGSNAFGSIAAVNGTIKGADGAALSIGYKDANGRNRIAVAYVGEDGIEADTWYRCTNSGEFVKA